MKLTTINRRGTRLDKLKVLAGKLSAEIDNIEDIKTLAPIAKQYREVIKEIDEIEGADSSDDEIEEIMQKRKDNGSAGAVRKSRA